MYGVKMAIPELTDSKLGSLKNSFYNFYNFYND